MLASHEAIYANRLVVMLILVQQGHQTAEEHHELQWGFHLDMDLFDNMPIKLECNVPKCDKGPEGAKE